MPTTRDVDLSRIRPHGRPASRSAAFEELSSILMQQGLVDWPHDTKFERFGNPDGGREGRGTLPDGTVWAWQSKYLFAFDAAAAGQVAGSVRRALETEPNLTRYFVICPFDLAAGDTSRATSAHTRWQGKVAEWVDLAGKQGRQVEFVFIGEHELMTALTRDENAGRVRYWFDTEVLSQDWQARHLETVVAKAGGRYSPRVHVEVQPVESVEGLGRTPEHVRHWRELLAEVRDATHYGWRAPETEHERFDPLIVAARQALAEVDDAFMAMIGALSTSEALPDARSAVERALEAAESLDDLLRDVSLQPGGYYSGEAASLYSNVSKAQRALWRASALAGGVTASAAEAKRLLVTGRAGVGKTHLLCDIAARRVAEGRPTLMALGQDFEARSPTSQLPNLVGLPGGLDEVFALLDAASEASGCIGLMFIDAVNESAYPTGWRDDLRALCAVADRYPNVAIAVSCRNEFLREVVDDWDGPTIEHPGFGEATDAAIERFTTEFGIEMPNFPVLNPEFSNPLFLMLTCRALATLGADRFPLGSAGITTVCQAFLEAANQRLAEPDRCDYDPKINLVAQVVTELAALDEPFFERTDVERITSAVLPDRPWSRSLMRALIAEGVLTEVANDRVTFGYQRLGDVVRATAIAEGGLDAIRHWVGTAEATPWMARGVVSALSIVVPEKHDVELVLVAADEEGRVPYEWLQAFVESLVLRSSESISTVTSTIVERHIGDSELTYELWDVLIRLACVPGHPFNASWLHVHLMAMSLAERDQSWSQWLVGRADPEDDTGIRRLVSWAWPSDPTGRPAVAGEVAELAGTVLGWMLSTTDRRVRDPATKALVSLGDDAASALGKVVGAFSGVNDPYIVERLTGAACGAALRTDDGDALAALAEGVRELLGDHQPEHLLTRDFARRVYAAARAQGCHQPDLAVPDVVKWPVETRTYEEIEALCAPPDYTYGSIWHSVTGFGDFGRYVIDSALRDFLTDDARELRHLAQRAIFDRALDLGWTPDRFAAFDQSRDHDGPVERIGKKYQWIGLYETLGRISDAYLVRTGWDDTDGHRWTHAEEVVWRDIDPTVLVRTDPDPPETPEIPWFSPTQAEFPAEVTTDHPTDTEGIPDPLALIAVTDPERGSWLTLLTNPRWEQHQYPEDRALRLPRLSIWMWVHAYLLPVNDLNRFSDWAMDKDWLGNWMPDTPNVHNALLGAHPHDPTWAHASGDIDWWNRGQGDQPCPLWLPGAWYGGTGTSRDASAEEEPGGFVPSIRLDQLLGLRHGKDFGWSDEAGLAVHDPAAPTAWPAALLMRRDLMARLAEQEVTLAWTVSVQKQVLQSDFGARDDDYRWVSASATYVWGSDGVQLSSADAKRCRPGPFTEASLDWAVRPGAA